MTIDYLRNIVSSNQNISITKKNNLEFLLQAIDDWPNKIASTDSFFNDLNNLFGKIDITETEINNVQNQFLQTGDLWATESLESLKSILRNITFSDLILMVKNLDTI